MSDSTATTAPVTVLGLGLMGQALAGAFLKAGHPTTVWNRSQDKAEQVVAQGATSAKTVGEAVQASPVVVICVSDYDVVQELLDPVAPELKGRVVLNLSTGTSTAARDKAAWASKRGIAYLDGAIMAIPPAIGGGEAVVLYSGPKEAFDNHEATLRVLAPAASIYLGTDQGLSSLYDMALLGLMWGVLNSFLHGAALLETANVPAATFAPLANTIVNVTTGFVTAYAGQIDAGDHPAGDSTVTVHWAAMEHLIEESETLGINTELPRFFKQIADRAVAAGHGENSYAALIEQFRGSQS